MGIVTSYSSAAIEKAKILHNGLTAYQKGKGCSNLVTTELSFREDCLESHAPAVQIDEDEEKFFDRIPVEILLAAMRVNGFPNQGYIEIKASAMQAKTVEIITSKGITYARFICGLEQGNPDSPTISNLVIKFKHDVWGHISEEIKKIFEKNNCVNQENYKFNSLNGKDGQVYLCKIGYSDDNSKFISIKNEDDLLKLVEYFTQLSGDISMVTKIGRKSAKCEIQFFNITAELAVKMKKVWSTAWSFIDDSPIEEQIPFKIHLKQPELEKFYRFTNFFELEEEDQLSWNKIIGDSAHRHLGLSCTLGADTSTAWQQTLEKMKEKLVKLNVYKMNTHAQKTCFNMLVGTIPTFVPVQVNFPSKELLKFDKYAASFCLKSNGLSASDSKIRMFLPETMGGLGLSSTMELDIIAVAREFEIIANNITLDSRAFRTRISALEEYPLHSLFVNKNHAREAIVKLARYGIYLRNEDEEIINEIMAEIAIQSKNIIPFNHDNYKDNCTIGIGLGKERNLLLMYGGPTHSILKALERNNWKTSESIVLEAKPFRISIKKLISTRNKILGRRLEDSVSFFNHWEWRNPTLLKMTRIPEDEDEWRFIDFSPDDARTKAMTNREFIRKCTSDYKIMWQNHVRLMDNHKRLLPNPYTWEGKFIKSLLNSKGPLIIATDGSHVETEKRRQTSSSFVICILDIRADECLKSREWEHRPVIPILSRTSALPQNFGTCDADIAHGEACAVLMSEMALADMPRVTITDSKAIRETMLKLRNLEHNINDRTYIRSIAGGVGKFLCGITRELKFRKDGQQNFPSPSTGMELLFSQLEDRNDAFLKIAKTWVETGARSNNKDLVGWEEEYLDDCVSKPILKVNSHQLDENGTSIKITPRYKKLIPNLSMLNANHHADCCAEYGRKFQNIPYNFNQPRSYLRFFFTCGGKHIDRNISDFCHDQFALFKARKLCLKETQGLLWRIRHHTTTSWESLNSHKGWLRALLGLSSTHTRRIYKSQIYRECSKAKLISNFHNNPGICKEIKEAGVAKSINLLSGCLWCSKTTQKLIKGNRNHAMTTCEYSNISNFRRKATNLIESKFKLFFLQLAQATNENNVMECLKKVEETFLELQDRNIGRLKPIRKDLNSRYISCDSILKREGLINIKEALRSRKLNFLCEIFGLSPNVSSMEIRDDQIGVADCGWLGLTPLIIDEIVMKFCAKIYEYVEHKDTANALKEDLIESWNEIKTLNMSKAIGVHRIICSSGRSIEKEWRKEFQIDINSFKKLKSDLQPSSPPLVGKRKLIKPATHERERGKKQKMLPSQLSKIDFKTCIGITCHTKYKSWCPNNNFNQNQIRASVKQCQRCGRYMTAIKQCNKIIQDIITSQLTSQTKDLFNYIRINHSKMQHNYKQLMRLINQCLHPSFQFTTSAKNQSRIPDRFKLIGNIICIAVQKASQNFILFNDETFQKTTKILDGIKDCKESDFSLNRKAEIKIKLLTSCTHTEPCTNQKQNGTTTSRKASNEEKQQTSTTVTASDLTSPQTHIQHNVHSITSIRNNSPTISEKKHIPTQSSITVVPCIQSKKQVKLANFAANIIRPSVCLSGDGMMKAVEILRSYKISGLYVASSEASNQIASWNLTQNWTQFATIFGSRDLYDNKPNGTYLIPVFSGGSGTGHWHLCVVEKIRRRYMRAWCINSLGRGNLNSEINRKIEKAFAPGRATLKWEPCVCRSQEELECGPRTILAMKIIKEGMEKNLPIEDSVKLATLWHHPFHQHTPAMVRENIAYFINNFSPSMITPPLRFRRRNVTNNNSDRSPTTRTQRIEIDISQNDGNGNKE